MRAMHAPRVRALASLLALGALVALPTATLGHATLVSGGPAPRSPVGTGPSRGRATFGDARGGGHGRRTHRARDVPLHGRGAGFTFRRPDHHRATDVEPDACPELRTCEHAGPEPRALGGSTVRRRQRRRR